ncbi:MAG: filamentous hemagglutinin N-terminal domain-containing protein [Desmonostoc vinosum HA7617-LM4]|jgi:filamentous hemagglutinin family protein|nr:filamentous hemagglutinin N-terminal domain-containing protein [Desmonostoc vinosum HA7617-LM4]
MTNIRELSQGLGIVIILTVAFSVNSAIAQVSQDETLPTNSKVLTQGNITTIEDGTQSGGNLFHSFQEFSILEGRTVEFKNAENIQNIISRVTGNSISQIDGVLKAHGTANLFLINPNGIIFGSKASLNIGGSFLASTASSLNFADGSKFSSTNLKTTNLLSISIPIGLQFGSKVGSIHNQSQASPNNATNFYEQPVGLQVQPGKTLALVGGELVLQGGNLTAKGGRIELGSVAENSFVGLNSTNQGWILSYANVQNFLNIQIIQRNEIPSYVDLSDKGSGSIQVQGKRILLSGSSQILANTLGSQQGGNLIVTASELVELIDPGVPLTTGTFGSGNAGDLTITTSKLIIRDGAQVRSEAQVSSNSFGLSSAGKLTVNASDSVELLGGFPIGNRLIPSGLFSVTSSNGNAGDITINTKRLYIQGGARVSTDSAGTFLPPNFKQFLPATGQGGNLTVNASEFVEITGTSVNGLPSGMFTSTQGPGTAGNLKLTTGQLVVRDGAIISVSSGVPDPKRFTYLGDASKLGLAGELNITARSILLDNKGKLTSETDSGKGGNISLQVQDLLLMRRNSQISTNAGKTGTGGDGGNITIDTPNGFVVTAPLENNDITANAFSGSGGKITVNAKNIFGFVPRTRADLVKLLNTEDPNQLNPINQPTSDITAFSQQNPSLNGIVQINTPDVDPSRGLAQLPVNVVETAGQIVSNCNPTSKIARGSFIVSGRGGIAPNPTEPLTGDAVLADWITVEPKAENRVDGIQNRTKDQLQTVNSVNQPTQIVEAQGWIIDANGNVVLVAQAPTVTPHNSALTSSVSCAAN